MSGPFYIEREIMEPISEARLALVSPSLAVKVRLAAAAEAKEGRYFRVAEGLRTFAEQDALYAQGRTKPGYKVTNAEGGYSSHNFGLAVDCYPFISGMEGALEMNNPNAPEFVTMIAALKAQGLVWGGDWKTLKDPPHFQLANVPATPTQAMRDVYQKLGQRAFWEAVDAGQFKTHGAN